MAIVEPGSRMLVDIEEAARRLSRSPRSAWQLAKDGVLPSVRVGRRRLFSVAALATWIEWQQGTILNSNTKEV